MFVRCWVRSMLLPIQWMLRIMCNSANGITLAGARGKVRDWPVRARQDSHQHNNFGYTGQCVSVEVILVAHNFAQSGSCPLPCDSGGNHHTKRNHRTRYSNWLTFSSPAFLKEMICGCFSYSVSVGWWRLLVFVTTTYADRGQQTEEIMFMADCLADVVWVT